MTQGRKLYVEMKMKEILDRIIDKYKIRDYLFMISTNALVFIYEKLSNNKRILRYYLSLKFKDMSEVSIVLKYNKNSEGVEIERETFSLDEATNHIKRLEDRGIAFISNCFYNYFEENFGDIDD